MEYQQILDKSIALFIEKTPGCNEEELFEGLKESKHEDFVSTLLAKSDYELFVRVMRERRTEALQEVFGGLGDMVSSQAESKDSHK